MIEKLRKSFWRFQGIISISRGKSEGRPEGAKRPTAGDEPREFTSRGEGGRVPPFFEKLRFKVPMIQPKASFLILAALLFFSVVGRQMCVAREFKGSGKDNARKLSSQKIERFRNPPTEDLWKPKLWFKGRLRPGSQFLTMVFGKRKRMMSVHIPFGLDGKRLVPVVFFFHDCGGDGRLAQKSYGLDAVADSEKFITVYPYGVGALRAGGLTWNVKFGWGEAMTRDVDDVGFFGALLSRLQKALPLDPARVYVGGFSAGACLAYRLGAFHSDKIAAIAAVAGAIGGQANDQAPAYVIPEPALPLPVIVIHGLKDEIIPFNGGKQTESFSGTKPTVIVKSVSEAVEFWEKVDGCRPSPTMTESSGKNVATNIYPDGKNGTEVVLVTVKNKGHSWPGWEASNVDSPSFATQRFNPAEVIWAFFKRHPRGGNTVK